MDAVIVLLILLFVLLAIGVPVGFAIGGATMISMFFFSDLNMVVNAQYCYSGIFSFTVMAIPYFMLAGTIMSTGGIARRIVDFASALIDFVTGALGCVSMLACMFFGALTGSGMESYNAPPSSLISTDETKAASPAVTMDTLYSPCAILKELDSGDILASCNASERIYPASLTKIMTALLAIENTPDLDQPIRLTEELFSELYFRHASVAGFQPGESVKGRDLLYGILLPSGAECCLAFANAISGSEEAFTILMNRKAEELGMKKYTLCQFHRAA